MDTNKEIAISRLANLVNINLDEQTRQLNESRLKCQELSIRSGPVNDSFCGVVWDGLMCWPSTPAGVTVSLQCPSYIHGFRSGGLAQRECTENGQWFVSPATKRTWTNFSDCTLGLPEDLRVSSELANQVANIKIIYSVGYALTSLTLIVAITTMLSFRKLHCPRNTIHINLFLSFILRAVISFLRDVLFVDGLGLKKDVAAFTGHKSTDSLSEDSSHWECRALMVVMNYTVLTNHLWIFIEGLYLCNMIFRDVFSENNPVTNYIVFGWLAALPSVLCWTCVRYFFENYLCWNVRFTASYFWIIRLPIVVIVVINFLFFVNILRVLFTKLQRTKTPKARKRKLRKLARSTLVLIPMLGIPNMFFLGMPDNAPELAETVKLYFEMIFNSYNGVVVAFLFCFLNGEVQSEMKRKWRHCRSKRRNEVDLKMSRRSLVNSTASTSFASCQHLASIKKHQSSQRLQKNYRPGTSPQVVSI